MLDVAAAKNLGWRVRTGSQIRLSVPEPRKQPIEGNYAVLVDGELRAGNRHLMETVTVDGRDFHYMVDANGFWQVHRQAPVMLAGHVIDLANKALDGMTSACIWDLYSGAGRSRCRWRR